MLLYGTVMLSYIKGTELLLQYPVVPVSCCSSVMLFQCYAVPVLLHQDFRDTGRWLQALPITNPSGVLIGLWSFMSVYFTWSLGFSNTLRREG